MIWIAITIQLLLSAGLLWATWQVLLLRRVLIETVKTVDDWTKACEDGLRVSSPSLEIARDGVGSVRRQYQILQIQLEKISKLLSVLGRGVSFVGSSWNNSRKGSSNSSSNSPINNSSGRRSPRSQHNVKRRK